MENSVYDNSILLIGPESASKTKLMRILSEKTNMPTLSLDDSRDKYYKELGYDRNYANKLKMEEGVLARYKYWKKFEAHHISRYLPTIKNDSIIKFEASQTVYEDPELFNRVSESIKKFKRIMDISNCNSTIISSSSGRRPNITRLHIKNSKCRYPKWWN